VAVTSLDEGECPAETDRMVDGQFSSSSSSTSRSTIVDIDSGADDNVQDTAQFVGDEYADDNDDDGDNNDNNEDDDDDDDDDSNCKDEHEQCEMWASLLECDSNPGYMLRNCKKSCNICGDNGSTLPTNYGDHGDTQKCEGEDESACLSVVTKMEDYMISEYKTNPAFRKIQSKCKNRHTDCALWATQGECDANPSYMQVHCAPVCGSCMRLDFSSRCPLDREVMKDALAPGDLHRMFERIVDGVVDVDGDDDDDSDSRNKDTNEVVKHWNATVHSRPSYPLNVKPEDVDYILGPWVITIDNFVTEDECERLKYLGAVEGYERSTDVGGMNFDGTIKSVESMSRTSYNAWCKDKCMDDPMTQSVLRNIADLTGISDKNSEHLQLLRYEEGQFYKQHHDYIGTDRDRPIGVRILTAYLYLNDVDAGGGTRFPKLKTADNKGLTVMPKRGRLLLWPSVKNDEPSREDSRTDHEALKVEKGEKYGANGWIHLRDFKTPYENNCV